MYSDPQARFLPAAKELHPGTFSQIARLATSLAATAISGFCACRKMRQRTENYFMAPTRKKRRPRQSGGRRPMTRGMLLPLPAATSRRRSLEHHLALAALRAGNCDIQLIGRLFRAVYVAYFVHEALNGQHSLAPFRTSEAALQAIATRIKAGGGWSLPESDHRVLEHVLSLHDEQLSTIPSHQIARADEQLNIFLANDALSPIAPDQDQDA
ncbi:hypothetical protein [Paraburkholderia caledonica]|uniref:Fis family transcriptional regulator n=1 Tax=Paraburkholderia caledonica TaxID=134536 RepID=A0AB73ILR8_9BURK|nr:hypothetical protein [Paraburkholderia caledonica]